MSDEINHQSSAWGQWIGELQTEDHVKSLAVLNVERRSPNKAQILNILPDKGPNNTPLRTCSDATISAGEGKTTGQLGNFRVYDPKTDWMIPIEQYCRENEIPEKPATTGTYVSWTDGDRTWGKYENNAGGKGTFELRKNFDEDPRRVQGPFTWDQFKNEISKYRSSRTVCFRGHASNKLPLQTLFHRCGRTDLVRYLEDDFVRLRHRINAVSNHYYESGGDDYLALLSLAQHHGYPTPLLDWSRSPYIAAFFAFECSSNCDRWPLDRIDPVRIYIFDSTWWPRLDVHSFKDPFPNLQFRVAAAHNNPRFLPQQSIASYTNVANIAAYVALTEKQQGKEFLSAIDIKAEERELVIEDLRLMGITASALFPGFEGICRSLRLDDFR